MEINEENLIHGNYYINYNLGVCKYKNMIFQNGKKYYYFEFLKGDGWYVSEEDLDKTVECDNEFGQSHLSIFRSNSWQRNREKILKEYTCFSKSKEALLIIESYKSILMEAIKNSKTPCSTEEYKDDFEVNEHIKSVLQNSTYPKGYIKNIEVEYEPSSKRAIINYRIPNIDEIPKIIEYKYNTKTAKIIEFTMKDKEFNKYYESTIFQITLRSIKEIFDATKNTMLESIVFNGWVDNIDKRTGTNFQSYTISLMVSRNDFEKINLAKVSLKDCIQYLKGVFVGELHQLAPIKPILELNKNDKRFVDSKEILSEINEGINLAEMDWEDFEYLVRELFEKIFSNDGSEVKVTQASRDGGVDAVAFDNDPIRGGKFIIQAKRYNNVVTVSAVRDLYGTVINEGAVKGILVTTSYFGNDSIEFAKNKPLALIDGSNIVYLLNEYGYKTHIKLNKK